VGEAAVTAAAPATPAVEREVAFDMIRRGLPVLPLLVLAAGIGWGVHGALSGAYGVGVVLLNFALAAVLLSWAARISVTFLMATAVGGFVLRMALVLVALVVARHQGWVEMVPLGLTLVITHVGLLAWETRHVSASRAFPGLRPEARS
jgi:hypothetical protein